MELQNISKLIDFQDAKMTKIDCSKAGCVEVWLEPKGYTQPCPCCQSVHVIRNGTDGYRKVKHLPMVDKKCILMLPKIRLLCKACHATFGWCYGFVDGKERYTREYKAAAFKMAIGSTVQHTATILETPYSTIESFFKKIAMKLSPITEEFALKQAQASTKLILGIDDFAIRKGHNYNTGIHDLRGETFLAIIKGRKLTELMEYAKNNPGIASLSPYAVVMDLAKHYHTFVKTVFPDAIRIADRFHVNGYIIESMNEIRRRISVELTPQAKLKLRQYKHVLNKRNDDLTSSERLVLKTLLSYSQELESAYNFKEKLALWYDCSPTYESALIGFDRWLIEGHSLRIPEIDNALKTFNNWRGEIVNYHRCRFTNGIVEGRNGKIKGLQRRRFFLQNRSSYEALIMLECNKELSLQLFDLYIC